MRRHPHKAARLSRREQRGHAQSRQPHRSRCHFLHRRRQLGSACFFIPRPNGCCAVRRAHLALRDATSLLPFLAQLHFLLILPRSPNLVSGWLKCHFSPRTSTCGKLWKCLNVKHFVIVLGAFFHLSLFSVNIFVQYGPRHCAFSHVLLFL